MRTKRHLNVSSLLATTLLLACAGCTGSDGPQGPAGPQGPPGSGSTSTEVEPGAASPGMNVAITGVSGGSASGGNFQAGDSVTVTFTLTKDDGDDWDIGELLEGRAMFSGPSFNYQRVIVAQTDVLSAATANSDGSYSYTFSDAIPATYLAPINDTPSFGTEDGELTGQALLDGTYTVGMTFNWEFSSDGEEHKDVGNAVSDVLFGASTTLATREVIKTENCNQCHNEVQAHGGGRNRLTAVCILCHTAGAEDNNDPGIGGGTPAVTIDFRIMIHKLHNGSSLPSVLGVATDGAGARDYTATPRPYNIAGGSSLHEFSDVQFPAWPNMASPMPRDTGYAALSTTDQATEDQIRRGITDCRLCHGDPDGSGPLTAPAQGDQIYTQLRRNTCGSCHDDVDFASPYVANTQTMPPQTTDSACLQCHPSAAGSSHLSARDAHIHPLVDPAIAPGVNLVVSSVDEAGTNDGDGTLDPGERVSITFTVQDDLGADVSGASLGALDFAISGPTSNLNQIALNSIPPAALSGAQPYTINVPEKLHLEHIGDATAGADVFGTLRAPHWDALGAATAVYEGGALGAGSTLAEAASAPANYIDVASGALFARDDFIVIDSGGGGQEFLQIQWVDADRLWFSSLNNPAYPIGPMQSHAAGVSVDVIPLTALADGVDFDLDPVTGAITETGGFTSGAPIVVTYTSDFEMPTAHGVPLHGEPALDSSWGNWQGQSLESGTYALVLWGSIGRSLSLWGETNSYQDVNRGELFEFLVGDATATESYDKISSEENCYACHVDIVFHGGRRRGYETCLLCHGAAGSGDRARFVAANAPETAEVTLNFRTLLHKLHHGAELDNASTFTVVGYGGAPYPDNFAAHTYEEISFPNMPTGTQNCASCHGESNTAWQEPAPRNHSSGAQAPTQSWRATCAACHDSDTVTAHVESNTSPSGGEACGICHGVDGNWTVEAMHFVR